MRTIVNYTTFKSNEEFVEWQRTGDVKTINSRLFTI